jgi:hypothetical protein
VSKLLEALFDEIEFRRARRAAHRMERRGVRHKTTRKKRPIEGGALGQILRSQNSQDVSRSKALTPKVERIRFGTQPSNERDSDFTTIRLL